MRRRWLGGALLAALLLHASTKGPPRLAEMLWSCHLASALMAVGLLAGWRRPVAAGFLFHVAIGLPGYLLDLLVTRGTTPTSVLVHLLPLVAGALALGRPGLPARTWPDAWAFFLLGLLLGGYVAPPELNVNLAHVAWAPLGDSLASPWAVRALNAALALGFLVGGELLLVRSPEPDSG